MKTLARSRDKAEILRRLREVRPHSNRRFGTMSAHQMICHLTDAFRMALGRKTVSPASGPLQRSIVKWIALYFPLPWPPGIHTRPEIDQAQGGTRPADFAADVAKLEALIEFFSASKPGFDWPPHPTFGPLTETAWLRWGYRHLHHHLRQFGA